MNSSFVQRTVFLCILSLSSVMSAQQMAKMKTDSALGEIEKLHQQDVAATVSSSVSGLIALWSDDGVLIRA